MSSQPVVRTARKRPLARLLGTTPVCDDQTGFIHHPSGFPLEVKRLWFAGWTSRLREITGDVGLIFESEKYVPPGALVEVAIPLRLEFERFRGRVVLVRHNGECYEIGIRLVSQADASRMRIVEQLCHIEIYLQQKKYFDGPYNLNRDRLAAEWIAANAARVPTG